MGVGVVGGVGRVVGRVEEEEAGAAGAAGAVAQVVGGVAISRVNALGLTRRSSSGACRVGGHRRRDILTKLMWPDFCRARCTSFIVTTSISSSKTMKKPVLAQFPVHTSQRG